MFIGINKQFLQNARFLKKFTKIIYYQLCVLLPILRWLNETTKAINFN